MSSVTQRKTTSSTNDKKLSVIIPAYAEQGNVRALTERLVAACDKAGITLDMLLVDDESSGTEETKTIMAEMQQKHGEKVRIHCRTRKEGRGLSSAVILGFRQAKYDTIMCMDADLQHEPEAVPGVAMPVLEGKAEFTVGSRFVEGGSIGKDWPFHRRLISNVATLLAMPLAPTSDPMSGFFCLPKAVFDRGADELAVAGFKISLEIMARCRPKNVIDVGIDFRERVAGESKLTFKQNIQYLQQLAGLYWARFPVILVLLFLFALLVLKTLLL